MDNDEKRIRLIEIRAELISLYQKSTIPASKVNLMLAIEEIDKEILKLK